MPYASRVTQLSFGLLLFWTLSAWAAETEIGTVTMPLDGNLSVAIYEPGGQIVRTLLSAVPQTNRASVKLVWDGKDDAGKPVPAGKYQWKSLASRAKGVDDGWIGELANPPYGELSEHGANVEGVAVDSEGNVYETSGWEEAHQELRVWSPEGKGLRYRNARGGSGLAVDEQYVYQLAGGMVRRYTRDNFLIRNWVGTLRGTIELDGGVVALGVGQDTLWVCGKDRVELHDKLTGDVTKTIAITAPLHAPVRPWSPHSPRLRRGRKSAHTAARQVPAVTSDAGRRGRRSTRSSQSTSKAGLRIGRSSSSPSRRTSNGSYGHISPVASSALDSAGHAVLHAGRVLSWPSRARAGVSARLATAAEWRRQLRISSTASFPRCPCGSG